MGWLELSPGFERLPRSVSDCRPWPPGGWIGFCAACGTVQKPIDDDWRDEAAAIHASYDLDQHAAGAEQPVFDRATGAPRPRSERVLELALERLAPFPATGRMLDVACGRGAMLQAFSRAAPGWRLHGVAPQQKSRAQLLAIPGVEDIYASSLADVPGSFDLVSIVHALEHVENPVPFLRDARAKLRPGGWLLIEVAYFADNPFDLTIQDHCTHFTPTSLTNVLRAAGLEPGEIRKDWVAKELTALARPTEGAPATVTFDESALELHAGVHWLETLLDDATHAAARARPLGLFGTSIAANWLHGALDASVAFFVDEDPARAGTHYRGLPVYAPDTVPDGATVFMALPRTVAAQIRARHARLPIDWILPRAL